ncbi:MAG: nucleoside deaminase [Gammaproteobacteria bacterium AqS3]|nr:nucleoside deaminase [Gammaproteobacteria bacterium AqS3]
MRRALDEARAAGEAGEVPVGAALVRGGELIATGRNSPITSSDPTAHAEIRALRAAGERIGNYRLTGAVLYCTIEPCAMCAGALVHARIDTLVFGALEPRAGAVVSTMQLLERGQVNHSVEVVQGVLAEESATLLRAFFAARR